MSDKESLKSLRDEIGSIDDDIIQLISKRMKVAKKIGKIKLAESLPIIDYKVEKTVIERSRQRARDEGLYEDLAEGLSRLLIKYSVLAQDEFHSRNLQHARENTKNILVVGGLGNMGMWLSNFFDSFGHNVVHYDQGTAKSPYSKTNSLEEGSKSADIIIIATPISTTTKIIEELISLKTKALVFDICSLKSTIIEVTEKAVKAGLKITSIHPMFGPDVEFLSGRNILICNGGDEAACKEAEDLFADTTANVLTLPLNKHDELMGFVLGLSHLSNLVFARVLVRSGIPFKELSTVASTTFNTQLDVTVPVINENQDLYYEIQAENSFTPKLIEILKDELSSYSKAIVDQEPAAFKALMEESRVYLNQ
jgi:chorismate mutase / prephenate dehydrogenase